MVSLVHRLRIYINVKLLSIFPVSGIQCMRLVLLFHKYLFNIYHRGTKMMKKISIITISKCESYPYSRILVISSDNKYVIFFNFLPLSLKITAIRLD